MSDIKLTNSGVIAEGSYFAVHAASFELKDEERFDASRGKGHQRKAMVHETDDRLVINHSNDYRGVLLNGGESGLQVEGDASFSQKTTVKDLLIEGLPHTFELSPTPKKSPFDLNIKIPGGLEKRVPLQEPSSLVQVIQELRKKIADLETKIQALEATART